MSHKLTNPFENFTLQGSNDSGNGLDGSWEDIFSSTVISHYQDREMDWREWSFSNENSFSAYRVEINSAYNNTGWAMYRWDLMASSTTVLPEPVSSTLFIAGGATLGFRRFRKKIRSN